MLNIYPVNLSTNPIVSLDHELTPTVFQFYNVKVEPESIREQRVVKGHR